MNYTEKDIDTLGLLSQLVSIPSVSGEENEVADFFFDYVKTKGYKPNRKGNNIWVRNKKFSSKLPTVLLNSHLDTVKPCEGWTIDPFVPMIKDNRLYGLGSNDASLSLSCLFSVFHIYNMNNVLGLNLILSATAEEEISGKNGIQSILFDLGIIELGIIGEPTDMRMAVAEKGLIVLDCYSNGKASHAAYNGQDNAIINCLEDLQWFNNYEFENKSQMLGDTMASVTQINAGQQHNVVPDKCHFVIDVRVNDKYSNQEVVDIIKKSVKSEVIERSLRLNSSTISLDHPIVKKGRDMGLDIFGSYTLSDQALLEFPTIKLGPGDSARSHIADEYIEIDEIEDGINKYIKLLNGLKLI